MMPRKFRDDIANGSGVIVLTHTDKQSQTDTAENNTTLATLHCAGGNQSRTYSAEAQRVGNVVVCY